jgi:FAD dependent oxidoreductase
MSAPERFDVAVVGGGPAGLAAALGAARAGAHTLLVEREERLGGNATQAFVHTICGLYRNDEERAVAAHVGLPMRLAEALAQAGGAGEPTAAGRVFYLPIQPLAFGALAHELCERTQGLALRTRTALAAAALGAESELALRGPSGEARAQARVVVDAPPPRSPAPRPRARCPTGCSAPRTSCASPASRKPGSRASRASSSRPASRARRTAASFRRSAPRWWCGRTGGRARSS